MADFSILISAKLDEVLSAKQLQGQLDKISKDLKVTVGIDPQQLNNLENSIKSIQDKLNNVRAKPNTLIAPEDEQKLKDSLTTFDQAIQKYKDLGTIKISNNQINPMTGDLEKFTVQVTKSTGEVEKFKYELASLKGLTIGGQENKLFVPTNTSSVNASNITSLQEQGVQLTQLSAEQDKVTQSLKKMYDQGMVNEQFFTNFNKAINSTQNLEQIDKLQAGLQRVSQYVKNQNLQQSLLGQSQSLLDSGKSVDTAGINQLVESLNNVNLSGANATRELALMQAQLRGFQSTATTVAEETTTLGNVLKNMSMYFGGYMLFAQALNAIKDGISTVNSLNQALTQISIVTYQNQQQVEALGESYNQLAKQMGVTTTDITNEATELYRQGLSADQVTERMKTITEYAKISSLDTKQASEIMTAAINSMGVSAQKAADTWSYLGDATATGADEIGKAMQKVGSTAGELNVPFDLVSSWIAVISSKTRLSAETIGDSVKSILARMQSLKEKGFDQTDGTQVNQVAKSLAAVGVQLVDSEGNFRNFGDVLKDLSDKWDGLSNREKAYLSTTVAG